MRGVQRRTRLGEQLSQRGRSTTSFSRPTREGEFVESAGGSELLHPYHTQTVRQCHWKLGKKIGSGTFGTVHKGLNEDTGMAIAVKVLPRAAGLSDNGDVRELENEIALMQTLDHPNIVRYLGCEVNP